MDTIKGLAARWAAAERTTLCTVRRVGLPGGGDCALITLDNGLEKPITLGFNGLLNLATALDEVTALVRDREVIALGITGRPGCFAAGADLTLIGQVTERAQARALAEFGHEQVGRLHRLGVPSFAFVNGVALGGGLEIALGCDYRTVAEGATVGLPETALGLVPGWGGCYRLPRLIGVAAAVEVIITNPAQNKLLLAADARRLGVADAAFGAENFGTESLHWAAAVLRGEVTPSRPDHTGDPSWEAIVTTTREHLSSQPADSAARRALDLIAAARETDEKTGFRAEDEALTDLALSEEFRAAMENFQHRRRSQ